MKKYLQLAFLLITISTLTVMAQTTVIEDFKPSSVNQPGKEDRKSVV